MTCLTLRPNWSGYRYSLAAVWLATLLAVQAFVDNAYTQEPPRVTIPETVVEAEAPVVAAPPTTTESGPASRDDSLIGRVPAASEGVFGAEDLATRPLFGPVNLLDPIPGFGTTQETSGADASVFYVRGVNVEHGTDFAIFLDDMPLNMPTHSHAQGLVNLNFMIPELVETVNYRKGSYYADLGDFSSVGAAKISLFRRLPQSIDSLGVGQYSWIRGLSASTVEQWGGDLTYAADVSFFDDGWDTPQKNQRFKALMKHTIGDEDEGLSTSLMAYHGDWYSVDAQPLSSILANGRFSNIDPTTGGRQTRASWNTQYWRRDEAGAWNANAYAIYDRFDIWINPEGEPTEQIGQPDGRLVTGLNLSRRLDTVLGDLDSPWTAGVQLRNDYINVLRRDNTIGRVTMDNELSHRVNIFTVSPYVENNTRWSDWSRTVIGVRSDLYQFDVTDRLDASQSGHEFAGPVCPKFSLVLGPWADTEYYFNMGTGFHSNDARNLFTPVNPVNAIARTKSAEVGLRSEYFDAWTTNVAVWYQEFESELVFNAEEGEIEALGPSRRYGVEWNNRFYLTEGFVWDVDWAWAHVRFENGDRVPQSLSSFLQTGPTLQFGNGMYGSLWFKHFSPRPLNEDGSLFSGSVEVANLQVGWRDPQWQVAFDVFNVFNSGDFAETFDEGGAIFVHPLDPTQARLTVTRYY